MPFARYSISSHPTTACSSARGFVLERTPAVHRIALLLVLVGGVCFSGCQRWPGSQQARQYQIDSERLLGEFRAQKKRADELALKNQMLEQRLADSEKTLARQNLPSNRSKSSSWNDGSLSIGEPSRTLSNSGSSRFSSNEKDNPSVRLKDFQGGLPDTPPSLNGVMTSSPRWEGGRKDLTGDPSKPNQWRPIQKK